MTKLNVTINLIGLLNQSKLSILTIPKKDIYYQLV